MVGYEVTIMTRGSSEFLTDYSKGRKRERQVAGGAGWYAQRVDTLPDRTSNTGLVWMGARGVYMNAYLLTTLAADEAGHYPVVAKSGRCSWYSFTNPDLQRRLEFHVNYPPRSNTEERIRLRTAEITKWMQSLVDAHHTAAAAEAAAK